MNHQNKHDFLNESVSTLSGVGTKIKNMLRKKKIEKISDLLWSFPHSFTDRSNLQTLNNLEVGKITTIKATVLKYNFPRLRNLPNKVSCSETIEKPDKSSTLVIDGVEIFIPLANLINVDKEIIRLQDKMKDYEGRMNSVKKKIDNE